MDFTPIFQPIYTALSYLIPLAILSAILKSAWFKGWFGEQLVNLFIHFGLDRGQYHLLRNVTLPTEDGSTQVDHVIVSPFGVFVIETKNMKGWIFGRANQAMWTQQIYRHKFKFQNPIHQNYKHKRVLQDLLALEDNQIFSVVVFVGGATFKTEMPGHVLYLGSLLKWIRQHQSQRLDEKQVLQLKDDIQQGRLSPSFKTHRAHVNHVKALVAEKVSASVTDAEPISVSKDSQSAVNESSFLGDKPLISSEPVYHKPCQRCGSKMVLRVAKRGANTGEQFWGCSSFPKCRAVERCN